MFNKNRSRPSGLDTRCKTCNKAKSREWFSNNQVRYSVTNASRQAARRAAVRKRVPWYDSEAVNRVYAEAQARREQGEDVQVDHLVPLRSKLVCGLHVQNNLAVVPRGPNLAKGNRVWPDMPDFCADSIPVIGSRAFAKCTLTSVKDPHQ